MSLFVMIVCERCKRQVQLRCAEGFDIADVEHECEGPLRVQRVERESEQAVMAV